ncbi:general secretion pathway protein GspB [Lysobacter arvi]|uniref:General secretion pathway protein GspB n=1 Tax=Lysobacter arvi TaxID=3038776 RepID=A0ABU1CEF5_9GAMM|nr:general secretion pathway protein GspB [Lysobacter arvi]MDR0183302.1 general secretion pathway protein GspB [Lysobacter arvi]
MSLILDALRKSEAQRRRGEMPDLRAELPPAPRNVATRRRWPFWFAGAAAAIAVVALAWGLWDRAPEAPPADAVTDVPGEPSVSAPAMTEPPAEPATATAPPSAAPLPRSKPIAGAEPEPVQPVEDDVYAAASAAYPPPTAQTPTAPTQTDPEAPAPTAPAPSAPPPARTDDRYRQAIANAAAPPAASRSPAATAAPVAPLPLPPPATGAPVRLADLSPGEREQLPALKISMHMFGPTPAQRFAIIDGARVGPGDRVGEAVVEEIAADGVVLNWHGRRVALPLR